MGTLDLNDDDTLEGLTVNIRAGHRWTRVVKGQTPDHTEPADLPDGLAIVWLYRNHEESWPIVRDADDEGHWDVPAATVDALLARVGKFTLRARVDVAAGFGSIPYTRTVTVSRS